MSSILVVDDEKASGELVATLLRSQGFQVRLASSGRAGLEIVQQGGVDLLILDLMMSKLDGVEVCAYVRNELADPFLPIIITTSLQDRESRIRAKEAGADDVLVKPLDGLELLVRIDSLMRVRTSALELLREREQLEGELQQARAQLASHQRIVRRIESAANAMRSLIDLQVGELELARKHGLYDNGARDHMQRFGELTGELRQYVDCLAGSGTVSCATEVSDVRESQLPRESVALLRK